MQRGLSCKHTVMRRLWQWLQHWQEPASQLFHRRIRCGLITPPERLPTRIVVRLTHSQEPPAQPPNFGASFAQGFSQSMAMRTIAQRNAGYNMMNWGSSYWLKSQYLLPAGGAACIVFLGAQLDLPLALKVNISGIDFRFESIGDDS